MDLHAMITLGLMVTLTLLMVWVIISDMVLYIIPNLLNGIILALYVGALFFLPVEPLSAFAAAGLVLVVGLLLFALGFMGGGDVKLLVVLTLWTGWGPETLNFLVLTAVTGGILVLIVLPLRAILGPILFKANPTRNLPRLLTKGQPVPYGIAIAAAFLLMLWGRGIPGLN